MKNIKDHVEITQHGFRFVLDEETVANETELKERAGIGNLYDEIPEDKAIEILGREKVDQLLGFLQVGLNRAPRENRETKDDFNAIRKAAYEEQSANLRAKQFDKDYPPQDLKETTADDSISKSKSKGIEGSQSAEFHADLKRINEEIRKEAENINTGKSKSYRDSLVEDESSSLIARILKFINDLFHKIASVFKRGGGLPNTPVVSNEKNSASMGRKTSSGSPVSSQKEQDTQNAPISSATNKQ